MVVTEKDGDGGGEILPAEPGPSKRSGGRAVQDSRYSRTKSYPTLGRSPDAHCVPSGQ